jgi:hypothetical protein
MQNPDLVHMSILKIHYYMIGLRLLNLAFK